MSKALNSPTARLLRSSRLFSLPPPLPQANVDVVTADGRVRTSDTATLPYPTHQAITAPASSLHRGDWGLKRSLPAKTTKTSTAHVRVNHLDTLEHITDFNSAADHARTLDKWQEMDVLMVRAEYEHSRASETIWRDKAVSAFDGRYDQTAIFDRAPEKRKGAAARVPVNAEDQTLSRATRLRELAMIPSHARHSRWRTSGPFLPYLSEVEFATFVQKVSSHARTRNDFLKFLLSAKEREKYNIAKQQMDMRETPFNPDDPLDVEALKSASKVNAAELEQFVLRLRDNHGEIDSQLGTFIQQFFDMPPLIEPEEDINYTQIAREIPREAPRGPPSTHPSAGLSYIRNAGHMINDPAHGPQLNKAPVQARVLRPRESGLGTVTRAKIGIGGVVLDDYNTKSFKDESDARDTNEARSYAFNFDKPGGNKLWFDVERAWVDPLGRIRLVIANADRETVTVHTGGADPRVKADDENETEFRHRMKNIKVEDFDTTASFGASRSADTADTPVYKKVSGVKPLEDERLIRQFKQDARDKKGERLSAGLLDLLSQEGRKF